MIRDITGFGKAVSKQEVTGSPSGPVKTYKLSAEELEYYRSLPGTKKAERIVTTGFQPRTRSVR